MDIRVERLCKNFGTFRAVDDVSFEVSSGELIALLGPSGSGKSTLLRLIAGLETADSGTIWFNGSPADHLHVRARGVGFVFQHYALFRHMSVVENVAFGLRAAGMEKQEARGRARKLLELVALEGLEERLPGQLSGGQRQRVALARALAPEPKILLLDEPFGAVDAKVREELRQWLRRLHDEVGVTSMFVTHDQEEAFSVADRVLVIQRGLLEQAGTPAEILDTPATEFVARFVGEANVFDCSIKDGKGMVGALHIPLQGQVEGSKVRVVVRIYDLKFWTDTPGIATVRRVLLLGDRVKVEAIIDGGGSVIAQFPRRSSLLRGIAPGVRIHVEVTTARAYATRSR